MNNPIKTIVLTGGPCAGKTTALAHIRSYLTNKGFSPILIPEAATTLLAAGLNPTTLGVESFQTAVGLLQLQNESLFRNIASTVTNPVLILDRAILDNQAYCTVDTWAKVLRNLSSYLGYVPTTLDLADRYDGVIHLHTGARKGFYSKDTNPHRIEDAASAITLDDNTLRAWNLHSHVKVIPCFDNFADKCALLEQCINEILGLTPPQEIERKFAISATERLVLINGNSLRLELEQNYLPGHIRIRKVTYPCGSVKCYITSKTPTADPRKRIEVENALPPSVYNQLSATVSTKPLLKTRHIVVQDGFRLEVDNFHNVGKPLSAFEVELADVNILLPEWGFSDVTSDIGYANYTLWKELNNK